MGFLSLLRSVSCTVCLCLLSSHCMWHPDEPKHGMSECSSSGLEPLGQGQLRLLSLYAASSSVGSLTVTRSQMTAPRPTDERHLVLVWMVTADIGSWGWVGLQNGRWTGSKSEAANRSALRENRASEMMLTLLLSSNTGGASTVRV